MIGSDGYMESCTFNTAHNCALRLPYLQNYVGEVASTVEDARNNTPQTLQEFEAPTNKQRQGAELISRSAIELNNLRRHLSPRCRACVLNTLLDGEIPNIINGSSQ